MITPERIDFLRGRGNATDPENHPVIQLTDEELRRVIGGVDGAMASSTMTGSYNATESPKACCDGTKVCCCIKPE